MATVVYGALALEHLERVIQSQRDQQPVVAQSVVTAIQSAVDNLAAHPLTGPRIEGDLRALNISYGRTGFVALYRFVIPRDEVRILALRSQRELGFAP